VVGDSRRAITVAECIRAAYESLAEAGYSVPEHHSTPNVRQRSVTEIPTFEYGDDPLRVASTQGVALGSYIADAIITDLNRLGVSDITLNDAKKAKIFIHPNSSDKVRSDIELILRWPEKQAIIPINLKASENRPQSLGSNSMRATLSRVYLGNRRVNDATFSEYFGALGHDYLSLMWDFKAAAAEFYRSPEGIEFVREYQLKKQLPPDAKVSNPLRRKEVGLYFLKTRHYVPEHRFAQLYVDMFNLGYERMGAGHGAAAELFIGKFREVLGIRPYILSLNAITDNQYGVVLRIENSFISDTQMRLSHLLRPGAEIIHQIVPRSSTMPVKIVRDGVEGHGLSLAVWKDASLQYKLKGL